MAYAPYRHQRRSIRLRGHGYTRPGAYFGTICTDRRFRLCREVVDGEVRLNTFREIVREEQLRTAQVRPYVELFEHDFVVMSNHILEHDVGATRRVAPTAPLRGPTSQSLGAIIAQFKSIVTKRINTLRRTPGAPVWQRNYYEHINRNERALNAIRRYIVDNPRRWHLDRYNPRAHAGTPPARQIWHNGLHYPQRPLPLTARNAFKATIQPILRNAQEGLHDPETQTPCAHHHGVAIGPAARPADRRGLGRAGDRKRIAGGLCA